MYEIQRDSGPAKGMVLARVEKLEAALFLRPQIKRGNCMISWATQSSLT